jgi:hypothetical protein
MTSKTDSQPVADRPSPSDGVDLPSAAIGAAAAASLLMALLATGGLTRRRLLTRGQRAIGA